MYMPIRVLCVMSTLDRGGAESMVMSLFRNIDRDEVIFDFVKHTDCVGVFEEEIKSLGGKVYAAPRYKIYNHFQYVAWWKTFFQKHPEYKIIHGHFFTISAIYFDVAQKANRITIGHSHCGEAKSGQVKHHLKEAISNMLIAGIESKSDYCMSCSVLAGKWVFKNKHFTVLKNAIDASKFCSNSRIAREVRKEFSLENNLVLGSVGRFNLQKNPYGILDIFFLVHKQRPDSRLLWIGDGEMRDEIEMKAMELGIHNDIIFTGIRNDVERLLQAMDVFVFPSFYEGLPVSVVEAQAAGIHCFISDQVSKEVDITGLCTFLSLNHLSDWSSKISKVTPSFEHPNMIEQIKAAGYDIRTTSKWLQDFYEKIYFT